MARGRFITLEGGEGAGKSTQAKRLAAWLESQGRKVLLTREPGGSPGAEEIRKLLVEGEPDRWTPLSETLLFIAARADHVARVIEPALAKGDWVISDRFSDSTFVYQGVARGLGVELVRQIQEAALGRFAPDLTLILDLPVEEGLKRAHARGEMSESRYEKFGQAFHENLRAAFHKIAASEPKRCAVLDGARSENEVAADIWRTVAERLHP